MGGRARRRVGLEAGPGAPFEMIEAHVTCQLVMVAFDALAELCEAHQIAERRLRGQRRQGVRRGRVLRARPFTEEPHFRRCSTRRGGLVNTVPGGQTTSPPCTRRRFGQPPRGEDIAKYCRATPTERVPFVENPVSSTTNASIPGRSRSSVRAIRPNSSCSDHRRTTTYCWSRCRIACTSVGRSTRRAAIGSMLQRSLSRSNPVT